MMDNNKVKKNSKNFIGGLNGIKLTYFVLFFGYGATLPYLALYFRQIGLNASYVGAIAGIRPMVQFVSCPLWAVISDKFRMRRIILNMSIISWLLFTVVLYIPRPKHSYCMDSPIFKDLISDNNNKTNIQRNDTTTNKYIWPKILGKLNNTSLSNKIPLKNNETMPFEFEISSKRSVLGSINSFQFRNPEHNHVSGRHYIETNNNITQTNPINITTDDIQQEDDFIIPEIDLFQKHNYIKQFNSTKNNNITTTNGCPIKAIKSKIIKKPLLVVFADENECIPLVFYDKNEVFIVFIIIITLTAVGEFFEAPAVSLLDVAILECLDQQMEKYGKTRLFGSLGFGISSFFVGITLDYYHSTICHQLVTNFMITLYFFVGSMCLAIIISLICIRFENDKDYTTKSIYNNNNNNNNNEDLYYKQSPCPICNNLNFKPIESSSDDTFKPCNDKYIHEYEFNKKKLPQNTSSFKEIILLLQQTEYFFFIMVSLFLGFSHGSIMNFINWFLEDLGASRLMMGSATVIRDFAVVFGFYISPQILTIFTQLQVIIWTFCVYIFSYFCYSIITHPWYAVPVECIQGLAYAIMWSSCITYFGGAVSKENCATMQGVIQGVYWGLGTGSGAIIGGISVFKYGCSKSFQLGGYVTCFAMLFFGLIYYIFVRKNDHQ